MKRLSYEKVSASVVDSAGVVGLQVFISYDCVVAYLVGAMQDWIVMMELEITVIECGTDVESM